MGLSDNSMEEFQKAAIREFATGATRDTDENKLKYLGFLSRAVLKRYAEYMHVHRQQANGQLRDPDNWKKGIPIDAYMDSSLRHFMERWEHFERGKAAFVNRDGSEELDQLILLEETLCAEMFNTMGMLFEVLKRRSVLESTTFIP